MIDNPQITSTLRKDISLQVTTARKPKKKIAITIYTNKITTTPPIVAMRLLIAEEPLTSGHS